MPVHTTLPRPPYLGVLYTVIVALLAILLLRPLQFTYFFDRYIGGSEADAGLYIWLARTFIEDPWRALTFESNVYFPYPLTRAWSDNFLLPSVLCWLLTSLGLTLVAAYNLIALGAQLLLAGSLFLLASQSGARLLPAVLICGVAPVMSYLTGNLGHPQLQYLFTVPLGLYFFQQIRANPSSWWSWALAGLTISIAFYTTVYFAVFLTLAFGVLVIDLLFDESNRRASLIGSLYALLGALPIIPVIPFYLGVHSAFGSRQLYEAKRFGASSLSYFSFSPQSLIWNSTSALSHAEAWLGVGLTVIASLVFLLCTVQTSRTFLIPLALTFLAGLTSVLPDISCALMAWGAFAALFWWYAKARSPLTFLTLIALMFVLLSFGPVGYRSGIPDPFSLMFSHLPGVDAIRASARFGVVALVIMLVGSTIALSKLGSGKSTLLTILAAGVLGVESYHRAYAIDSETAQPAAFEFAQEELTDTDAAVVLPMIDSIKADGNFSWGEYAKNNVRYMNWAHAWEGYLVNGYSGQRPKIHESLPQALVNPSNQETLDKLSRIVGTSYLITVEDFTGSVDSERISLMRRFDDSSAMYRLDPTVTGRHDKRVPWFAPAEREVFCSLEPAESFTCEVQIYIWRKTELSSVRGLWKKVPAIKGAEVKLPSSDRFTGTPFVFSMESPCLTSILCRLN